MAKKEYPILFSSQMVRGILDGRKTQTRRVVKMEATDAWEVDCQTQNAVYFRLKDRPDISSTRIGCPYGEVGDKLWVRENVRTLVCQSHNKTWEYGEFEIEYIADRTIISCPEEHEEWWRHNWHKRPATTIPSIHMPKWACRLWLEITNIRVERVQDISEADANAEGSCPAIGPIARGLYESTMGEVVGPTFRDGFHELWDSINAKRGFGWEVNPWVWVIEFRKAV